jgi:hypothetical protein
MGDLRRTHRLRSTPYAQTRLTAKAIAPRPRPDRAIPAADDSIAAGALAR